MAVQPPEAEQVNTAVRAAIDYWNILHRLTPLVIVGGIVGLATNIIRITHEKTWLGKLSMCFSVVAVGCVAAGAAALGLELFMTQPTPEIELLVASVAGASGQKIFDVYSCRIFGVQTRYGNYEFGAKSDEQHHDA